MAVRKMSARDRMAELQAEMAKIAAQAKEEERVEHEKERQEKAKVLMFLGEIPKDQKLEQVWPVLVKFKSLQTWGDL